MKSFYYSIAAGIVLVIVILACDSEPTTKDIPFKNDVIVELPEEYHEITPEDNLRGYYTEDGILHIEFNNPVNRGIDYQLELRKDEKVAVYDEFNHLLGITSFDSISQFIEQDNL